MNYDSENFYSDNDIFDEEQDYMPSKPRKKIRNFSLLGSMGSMIKTSFKSNRQLEEEANREAEKMVKQYEEAMKRGDSSMNIFSQFIPKVSYFSIKLILF